jgi:hypothetical protein
MAVGLKNLSPCVVDWGMRRFYLSHLQERPPDEEGLTDS